MAVPNLSDVNSLIDQYRIRLNENMNNLISINHKRLDKLKDSELFKEYRKFLSRQEVYVLFLKFGFILYALVNIINKERNKVSPIIYILSILFVINFIFQAL